MGRLCFVPGCNTGTYKERKKNSEAGVKNPSLFKAPNSVLLDKWNEMIPGKDREMSMKDQICENHFEKKYIIRNFQEKLNNGTLFILKRIVPTLDPDAVPTIFSVSSDRDNLADKSSSENLNSNERMMDILSRDIKVENVDESDAINPLRFDDSTLDLKNETNVDESDAINPLRFDTLFDFNYVVRNLQDIQKPTSSWTVSFISEGDVKYVMCAMWSNYLVEKRMVIDTSLNIKVFLKNKQVESIENDKVHSIDDISYLLDKVNYYDPCLGINEGRENCLLFFDRRFQKCGRPNKWCSGCSSAKNQTPWKKSSASSEKEKLEKKCQKYSLMTKRCDLLKKQNLRLTKRVQRLNTRLKYFKEFHITF